MGNHTVGVNTVQTKILHVITDERLGGPQRRVLQVARHLKEKGFINIVAIPQGDMTFADLLHENGIPCYQVRNFKRLPGLSPHTVLTWLFYFVPGIVSLRRLIKRENVDIVHTGGWSIYLQGPLAAKLAGARLVWYLEDIITPRLFKALLSPLLRFMPDKVVATAKVVGVYFLGQNTGGNIPIIYPPVDTSKFRPNQNTLKCRSEFGLGGADKVVGTVGNINPAKGYEYFFPAIGKIKKACPEAKFLVVGKKLETQEKYWRRLQALIANLEMGEDLTLTGHRLDIPEMINLMDIFVLSSVSEATPMVILEAMACAKPVVATQVGGVPEVVTDGETGILVPPRDPEAIAEAVLHLLNHPKEAREMGLKGRNKAVQLFDIEECVQKHRQLYESLQVQ